MADRLATVAPNKQPRGPGIHRSISIEMERIWNDLKLDQNMAKRVRVLYLTPNTFAAARTFTSFGRNSVTLFETGQRM
jgi:hypothetical protein